MTQAELRALIADERERFGAPGLAVAVVSDGRVLLCEGFGVTDLVTGSPVTPDSLFALSSDTKTFTAATLCGLADDGFLDLDAPVRSYIPWFKMSDPHASALATTRDLLAHRTGLARHDLVWATFDDSVGLEDCARALAHLEPAATFRERHEYSNLAYNAAGFLTEQLTGATWSNAVSERILTPLGMTSTGFDAHAEAVASHMVTGYRETPEGLQPTSLPCQRRLGPAGGMVTSARDMSRWLLARLGHDVDGHRLAPSLLAELHTPAILEKPGTTFAERVPLGYGLGTRCEIYRETMLVHHGGSLPGFMSDVFLAPEHGIGVVVLSSLASHLLPEALSLMIIDLLTGRPAIPWGQRRHDQVSALLAGSAHVRDRSGDRPPSRPLAEFAGRYRHPAYGRLDFTVAGDRLEVAFHGFGPHLTLEHLSDDLWELVFDHGTRHAAAARADSTGDIMEFAVALEPSVAPIVFSRTVMP